MSATQPGNPKESSKWFGELSKKAGDVKKNYDAIPRKVAKAESKLTDAMLATFKAHQNAFQLVGKKSGNPITVIPDSNPEAHRKLWLEWFNSVFDAAYSDFTKQNQELDGNNEDN